MVGLIWLLLILLLIQGAGQTYMSIQYISLLYSAMGMHEGMPKGLAHLWARSLLYFVYVIPLHEFSPPAIMISVKVEYSVSVSDRKCAKRILVFCDFLTIRYKLKLKWVRGLQIQFYSVTCTDFFILKIAQARQHKTWEYLLTMRLLSSLLYIV